MLTEIKKVSQTEPRMIRRWFTDEFFDLFTWQTPDGMVHRFELDYAKHLGEHALVWDEQYGYTHHGVDSGETDPADHHKMSPMLVSNGAFELTGIARSFQVAAQHIDDYIAAFVYRKLQEYPGGREISGTP